MAADAVHMRRHGGTPRRDALQAVHSLQVLRHLAERSISHSKSHTLGTSARSNLNGPHPPENHRPIVNPSVRPDQVQGGGMMAVVLFLSLFRIWLLSLVLDFFWGGWGLLIVFVGSGPRCLF